MRWLRERPLALLILLCVALAIMIGIASRGNAGTSAISGTIVTGFSPLQRFASNITQGISGAFSELFGGTNLEKEHAALLKRVATLEMETQQYREQAKENERLTAMLKISSSFPTWNMVGARVISASPTYWQDTLIVDKGEKDGIEKDMVVVFGSSVVGRVVEVSGHTAKIMTLIDSQSAVSGIIERSRENGIVKGLSVVGEESRLCRMEYLSSEADLVPGDRVLTSGLGGIYPKGLLLGEVTEIGTGASEIDHYAIVKPAVDLAHIEEVLIIVDTSVQAMPPTASLTPSATDTTLPNATYTPPTPTPLLPTPPPITTQGPTQPTASPIRDELPGEALPDTITPDDMVE